MSKCLQKQWFILCYCSCLATLPVETDVQFWKRCHNNNVPTCSDSLLVVSLTTCCWDFCLVRFWGCWQAKGNMDGIEWKWKCANLNCQHAKQYVFLRKSDFSLLNKEKSKKGGCILFSIFSFSEAATQSIMWLFATSLFWSSYYWILRECSSCSPF